MNNQQAPLKSISKRLKTLEEVSRKLDYTAEARSKLNQKVNDYADQFLNKIEHSKAYYNQDVVDKDGFKPRFPEEGTSIEALLEFYENNVNQTGLNPASGGHLGYIPGGGVYPGAMGDYLADVTNRYGGVFFANPGAVRMENMCINWMRDMIGFPETTAGNLASGGSIANLIAIVTARDAYGIQGKHFEHSVVYLSDQVHHCVDKALRVAGMGEAVQRFIPMDSCFSMQADHLEEQIRQDQAQGLIPWMVVASAGTTDAGAIDPLENIATICQDQNLWFHIDGAYGAFFMLCEEDQEKFKGIDQADSVVMDPHKGLFLPYGIGAVLIRHGQYLYQSHYYQANYMQDATNESGEASPSELSPELTKHFRGLRMWLPMMLYGLKPFKAALQEKLELARYFYHQIANREDFELGPFPQLSVVLFRYKPENRDPNEMNKKLIERFKEDGRVFISSTKINEQFWLRVAILSFRTHKRTIDLFLELLPEKLDQI